MLRENPPIIPASDEPKLNHPIVREEEKKKFSDDGKSV